VIAAGDLLNMNSYPFIDEERGGHIDGVIAALNRMLLIAVPADKQEGGTMIIPGHGRLTDEADVVEYRDMLTIIRARIQASVSKGLTLEQVKATRPTFDYDGRWGQTTGRWTTEQFIEAVYRGVKSPAQQEH
jgi:glyoxylase-like metal-dependent hydrolase (beta-lactamase superfamily II)